MPPSATPTGWTASHSAWLDAFGGTFLPVKLPENSSGMNCEVACPAWPVAADAVANVVVGSKPPSNQPQDSPALFSTSPMFSPLSAAASRVEQSSQ